MDLDRILQSQDGLVTRAQALASLSPSAVRHRLRPGGPWQRLTASVYLGTTGAPTHRQHLRAGLLLAGPHAQLTGHTALELHGLVDEGTDVHLLVPHQVQLVAPPPLVLHRTHRLPLPHHRAGLPISPVARSVVEAGRLLDDLDDVRALVAAAVQRRRTTVERLRDEVDAGHSAGSRLLRVVLDEVQAGVRSAPEAVLRRVLRSSRVLPEPLWNCRLLHCGRWLADPDGYLEEAGVAVEYDSRAWHLSPRDWEATLARHDRMTAAGLRVLHVTPERLRRDPAEVLRTVEAAYRAGRASGPPPGVSVLRPRQPLDQAQTG